MANTRHLARTLNLPIMSRRSPHGYMYGFGNISDPAERWLRLRPGTAEADAGHGVSDGSRPASADALKPRERAAHPVLYVVLQSPFGSISIVWRQGGDQPIIHRVFLSNWKGTAEDRLRIAFPRAQRSSHPAIAKLGEQMLAFLEGHAVSFGLETIALNTCSSFQRRVLLAEHSIPRGWVSTYGLIAGHVGVERGARAVGSALACNPFPLIIPCHRAIRSDGSLGGYQGGPAMKRRLLELENVSVSETGKVVKPKLYYQETQPK
jgi:methylated-DNA-[protein]-cysteine S-methyltransferase